MSATSGPETGEQATVEHPPPPAGLRASGRRLWVAVLTELELDSHEELLLVNACRAADRLDLLDDIVNTAEPLIRNGKGELIAHPALVEARQQSIVLSRLIASLRMPDNRDDMKRPQRRGGARGAYLPRRIN